VGSLSLAEQYLNYIDMSIYSQGLLTRSLESNMWGDAGGQINFVFKHWYNLETTLSAGAAKAWYGNKTSWDWFVSFKLLQNLE
jgi:hypothetical protein